VKKKTIRETKKSASKKPEQFSGIFYRQVEKTAAEPPKLAPLSNKRLLLTWFGASLVMIVLVTGWALALPSRLRILNKETADFKNLWRASAEQLEDWKNLNSALAALKETSASTTATVNLTAEQVKNLKERLNEKRN